MNEPMSDRELKAHGAAWLAVIDDPDAIVTKLQRTPAQNRALHLWLQQIADQLNASGQSLGDGVLIRMPVAFTGDNLKENVLKPYMGALYPDHKSTTQLTTTELIELCDNLALIIAERSGVEVPPFPSIESL